MISGSEGLPFKEQFPVAVRQMTREPSLHPRYGIDGNLRGGACIVGALSLGGLPWNTQFGQSLPCGAQEPILSIENWLSRQARYDGAAIHPVSETDEALLANEYPQNSQDLILAAKIPKLARQKDIIATLARHARFDPGPQCFTFRHDKNPTLLYAKTRHMTRRAREEDTCYAIQLYEAL